MAAEGKAEARPGRSAGRPTRKIDAYASLAFRQALLALRVGRAREAADGFRELVEGGSEEPLHLSYHGLMLATHGQRGREGTALCESAFVLSPGDPRVQVNLARVYASRGRHEKAVALLRAGLRRRPRHPALQAAIDRISPRRRPPFRSLDRDHAFNKYAAKLRARLFG